MDLSTYHLVDLAYSIIRLMDEAKSTEFESSNIQMNKDRKSYEF